MIVTLNNQLLHKNTGRNNFSEYLGQTFAANYICKIPCITRWVWSLLSTNYAVEKRYWQSWDANLGLLNEKRKCYLCAAPPLPGTRSVACEYLTMTLLKVHIQAKAKPGCQRLHITVASDSKNVEKLKYFHIT